MTIKTTHSGNQKGAWGAVIFLCLVAICSLLDRTLLSFVLVPLQRDFQVSDFMLGLLAGPAFAIAYLAASFPIGFMVDKYSRRRIIIVAVSVWTLAAIGCALSPTFALLIMMRACVGAGEAAFTPVVNSMIGDFFAPRRRAVAIAICMSAGTLGISIAFLFGGAVVAWLSNTPVLHWPIVGELSSWRATLLIGAASGLLLAPMLFLFLREPERSETEARQAQQSSQVNVSIFVRRNWLATAGMTMGPAFMGMGPYTFLAWMPVFYFRTFDWSASQAGVTFALTCGIAAFVGSLMIGFLPGLLRRWRVSAPEYAAGVIAGVIANLAGAAAMLAPGPEIATALLTVAFLGMTAPYVFALSMVNVAIPAPFRGRITALFMIAVGLITNAGGTMMVGFLSDKVFADPSKLYLALFIVWICAIVIGAAIMAAAWSTYLRLTQNAADEPIGSEEPV